MGSYAASAAKSILKGNYEGIIALKNPDCSIEEGLEYADSLGLDLD